MLSRFSIIIAVGKRGEFGSKGKLPWYVPEDLDFFSTTTSAPGSCVIMGRNTYNSLPSTFRPLPNRKNIIVSASGFTATDDVVVVDSITTALTASVQYSNVFVIGGAFILNTLISRYMYLCNSIYISLINIECKCDLFLATDTFKKYNFELDKPNINFITDKVNNFYSRYKIMINEEHPEQQYLNILSDIIKNGTDINDRTGVGVRCIDGVMMKFDCSNMFPILTTRKIPYKNAIKEIIWMISGSTDTKLLEKQGVMWWKANTSREFLSNRHLAYREGDIGAGYGHQLRHYDATYYGCEASYNNCGIDQLLTTINNIKAEPYSRRHIITLWNPKQIHHMALPPCHGIVIQFIVRDNKLSLCMYQRSADMMLGIPTNIVMYATLLYIVADVCNLQPSHITISIGHAHIYSNHINAASELINRQPLPMPTAEIKKQEYSSVQEYLANLSSDMVQVFGYEHHPHIKMDMAV
jgi:dihydrofolate reductase/thymidylate synthase